MFTIAPVPRSCIAGSTAWVTASTLHRFSRSPSVHSSSSVWTKNAGARVPPPALFTSTSSGPTASTAAATPATIEALSVTSISMGWPSISPDTSRARVGVEVGHGDPRALGRQPPDGGGPDARGAAGDEGAASFQAHGERQPILRRRGLGGLTGRDRGRDGRVGLRPRAPPGAGRHTRRDRLARRRAGRGGGRRGCASVSGGEAPARGTITRRPCATCPPCSSACRSATSRRT